MLSRVCLPQWKISNGQSTVGGPKTKWRPKWRPFWSRECQNPVRNKVILTKMVVWTMADLNGPKWTSLGQMDQNGPKSRECQNPVRNKVILTKMVVWTMEDLNGPVHFPTVPRPLSRKESTFDAAWRSPRDATSLWRLKF